MCVYMCMNTDVGFKDVVNMLISTFPGNRLADCTTSLHMHA